MSSQPQQDPFANWVKVTNYKCFGEEPEGFEDILPFNIIIGRNNTGKSALLDLIEYLCTRTTLKGRNDQRVDVLRLGIIDERDYLRAFQEGHSDTKVGDHRRHGRQFLGKTIRWRLAGKRNDFVRLDADMHLEPEFGSRVVSEKRTR